MKRIYLDYLNDMLSSIQEIESFTIGVNYQKFIENRMLRNAVVRSLEVLGEASKGIPDEIREKYSQIPWKRISGMRDKLIHNYFGVDYEMVWNVVIERLPEIKSPLESILKEENSNM
jgi:uncharacterized protein with HEPN domain